MCSCAIKLKRKGRAKGDFILGIKKNLGEEGTKIIQKEEVIILSEIIKDGETVNIISEYNSGSWKG